MSSKNETNKVCGIGNKSCICKLHVTLWKYITNLGVEIGRRIEFDTLCIDTFFFLIISLLLSSLTRTWYLVPGRRFYPQRSSGQGVVKGVVPSPPPLTCLHVYRA